MKIAMLVHNPVVGDARVRKEAGSLAAEGFQVDLFGYGNPISAPGNIENCKLTIARKSLAVGQYSKGIKILKRGIKILERVSARPSILLMALLMLVGLYLLQNNVIGLPIFLHLGLAISLSALAVYMQGSMSRAELIVTIFLCIIFFVTGFLKDNYFLGIFLLSGFLFLAAILNFTGFRGTTVLNFLQQKYMLPATHEHIANQLVQKIDLNKYDVIHAHDIIALIAAVKLKRKKPDLKLVWDAHELYPELNYRTKSGKRFMHKTIAESSGKIDHFITINDSFVDYYQKNFPKVPSATVLMNAARRVNLEKNGESPLRATAGISSSQFVLLFQGGLTFDRGIEILIDAAEKMPENWSIIFMGDGPLAQRVDDEISKLKGTRPRGQEAISRIPAAPYQELARWTAGADIGIIPYENVGSNHLYCTPNKLWEFPNADVPILASGMVEISKMIEEHKTGLLLPREFTSNDIIKVLENINRSKLDKLVKNCRKFNEVEHWEKYEKRLVKLYEEISK
ncbi:glycosyltransferase family 4 protein [Alphaproteobacteria bacterium]|nr:glycosyltransferase family 4 protein [Alphaproteobacteria bacterium]